DDPRIRLAKAVRSPELIQATRPLWTSCASAGWPTLTSGIGVRAAPGERDPEGELDYYVPNNRRALADLQGPARGGGGRRGSEADAVGQAGEGAGAVAFEAELAFADSKGRFDPSMHRAEATVAACFVAAVGAEEVRAVGGRERFELGAGDSSCRRSRHVRD